MEMEITDPFHKLPDDLLIEIISCLDVRSAGITSVLSKRWQRVWSEMPRLEFHNGVLRDMDLVHFVSWVNRAISIRKGDYLDKFMVDFMYCKCFASDVDAWVEFCVKNKVKRLTLSLYPWRHHYTPPQVMYSYSSLTTLYLSGCMMACKGKLEWQSLNDLTLVNVVLNQHLLDEILSTCSVLSNLKVLSCCGFKHLDVNSRHLKSLAIKEDLTSQNHVDISAPFIRSLDIEMLLRGNLEIRNIPDVVTATIDLFNSVYDQTVATTNAAKDFLENFKRVTDLHLHCHCFQVLSNMMAKGLQLPQFKLLQHLKIHSYSSHLSNISGIICLLKSSPNLETLLLNGFKTKTDNAGLHPGDLDGDLLHLRKVTINNFAQPLLMLASILLWRAPALEEMVVAVDVLEKSEYTNISDTLFAYPKSSSKAKIGLSRK